MQVQLSWVIVAQGLSSAVKVSVRLWSSQGLQQEALIPSSLMKLLAGLRKLTSKLNHMAVQQALGASWHA